MKPVANSHAISTLIASFLSSANRRSFCLMGLAVTEMFNECSISFLGMPGMSTDFHAKTSTCSHRKLTSASFYLGSRSAPIQAVLDWSSRMRTTSLNSLDLVEARETSRVGISRSSGGITYEVMMQSCIWMEMSVALASAKLSFS